MASVEGGILRGQGRQHLGGIANVIVYWFIALPVGLALAFQAYWGLYGLWAGMVHPGNRRSLKLVTCIGIMCFYFGSRGFEK